MHSQDLLMDFIQSIERIIVFLFIYINQLFFRNERFSEILNKNDLSISIFMHKSYILKENIT